MRSIPFRAFLCLLALSLATHSRAQDPEDKGGGNGAPQPAPELPGFVWVPSGNVHPGCTYTDYRNRATSDILKRSLVYDVWGSIKPFPIEGFFCGKYEVTNAQWKLYLDRNFREEYETNGTETLPEIAKRFVKFRGEGVPFEWQAIYALNCETLVEAWKKEEVKPGEARWLDSWKIESPPVTKNNDRLNISKFFVPKGLKLTVYRHRIPPHWYGWCKLAGLRIGREYVDPRAAPEQAFIVPDKAPYNGLKLRSNDFARYPVRYVAPREMLAFAEWAGCHLPSEYEFERAGRADRDNKDQHTFPGRWEHEKQARYFAFADNTPICDRGPLAVDDVSVEKGDSPYGARHLLGNVWELTRTFYDLHPRVSPAPPAPQRDLTNYALTAKGGCFGDRWQLVQLSTRTPTVGNADLDLKNQNRADSLGFRLVRHAQPGYDLMAHTLLRLTYDAGNAAWNEPYPHAYAMRRLAGLDEIHIVKSEAPYQHVQKKAKGIAFVPLWMTGFTDKGRRKVDNEFRQAPKKLDGRTYFLLGALRCDVPLRAGVRMTNAEVAKLVEARKVYAAWEKAYKQASRKKREQLEAGRPPKPPEPDAYEKATARASKQVGLWKEKTIEPGEWLVCYWYGFIGLVNKARIMPPDAILTIKDPRKTIKRVRKPEDANAKLELDAANNVIRLFFTVEEQPIDKKKQQMPPDEGQSHLWAISEVDPRGWWGRRPSDYSWQFELELPTEEGVIARHKFK